MDKILVIGGGGHAKVIISILKKIGIYEIVGYTDLKGRGKILGVAYLGNDNRLEELYSKENIKNAVIGIGQIRNVESRKKIAEDVRKIGFEFPSIISPDSIINEDVSIGRGTVIMDSAVINSGTKIGTFSIVNTKASIDHDCEISDFVHIAPGVTLSGGVKVGNGSLIGAGVTIIQYKSIGENCIIGAGSLVVKDCLEKGKYLGIPAKLII